MTSPTKEELEILPKFRERVQDLNLQGFFWTDLGLLQWLRARDLHLVKAEEMLRKAFKWRTDNQIDSILSWEPPSDLLALCPFEFCGFDKENSPILYFPYGQWDIRKIYNMGYRETYIRNTYLLFEKLLVMMKDKVTPSGEPVTQFASIVNMDGLSVSTLASIGAMNMALDATKDFELYHPETLKKSIVINANRVFAALFALIKPILSQRTSQKLQIFDSRMEVWMPVILDCVTEDQLPKHLVDKWKDWTNPNKTSLSRRLSRSSQSDKNLDDYTVVTVGSGQKLPIELKVNQEGSVLCWSFFTDKFDIGFSLICDDSTVIVPYSQVNSNMKEEEGSVVCERVGTYTFVFDNSYSRMRSKVLHYRITNVQPN